MSGFDSSALFHPIQNSIQQLFFRIWIIACFPVLLLSGCAIPITVTRHYISAPDHRQLLETVNVVRRFALDSGYCESKPTINSHKFVCSFVHEAHYLFGHTRVIQVIQEPSGIHIIVFDIPPEGPNTDDLKELEKLYNVLSASHTLSGIRLDQEQIKTTMDIFRFAP